jgi:hypothetical protein
MNTTEKEKKMSLLIDWLVAIVFGILYGTMMFLFIR